VGEQETSHKLFHFNWMDRDAINMSVCIRFKLVLEIGGSAGGTVVE
jgi:hypothetical protein